MEHPVAVRGGRQSLGPGHDLPEFRTDLTADHPGIGQRVDRCESGSEFGETAFESINGFGILIEESTGVQEIRVVVAVDLVGRGVHPVRGG